MTVELAREFGRRLGREVELSVVTAARESVDALSAGHVDLGFVAYDPARATELVFTRPYVVIEGCYAVPAASALTIDEIDHAGLRIGTKLGSALDLHLQRVIRDATVVQLPDHPGTDAADVDAITGIRGPLTATVAGTGWQLLEPAFMEIRQCVALSPTTSVERAWVEEQLDDLLVSGMVARSLAASGQPAELAAS